MHLSPLPSRFAFRLLALALAVGCGAAALAAVGDGAGGDRVTVRPCPEGGAPVCARITGDGAIHLLYDRGGLPWYTVSRDGGRTFKREICPVDSNSRRPGLEFSGADMAVTDSGRVFVALSTNAWKLKLPQDEWSLHFATLEPGASAFSPVLNLNRKASQGFSLAADNRGNVAAVWISDKLYANFSGDAGRAFSPNAEISGDCDPCPCCMTRAVFGANGDLAVLYRDKADDSRDMYVVIRRSDGTVARRRVSGAPWKIDACPMSCFALSRAGDGYVAAWPTKGRVFFVRLDKDGAPLAPGEVAAGGQALMHEGVLAAAAADGTTLIAWKHGGRLNWRVFDSGGRPEGPEGSAGATGDWAAGAAVAEGRFVLIP